MAAISQARVNLYADLIEGGMRTLETIPELYRVPVEAELVKRGFMTA